MSTSPIQDTARQMIRIEREMRQVGREAKHYEMINSVAEALRMDPDALAEQLQDGASMAQIAKQNGLGRDQLQQAAEQGLVQADADMHLLYDDRLAQLHLQLQQLSAAASSPDQRNAVAQLEQGEALLGSVESRLSVDVAGHAARFSHRRDLSLGE